MSDHAAPPAPTAEGEAPPAGGLKAKLPMIVLIIAGLAIGGGSGAVVVGPILAKKMGFTAPAKHAKAAEGEHGEEAPAEEGAASEEAPAGEHGAKGGATSAAPPIVTLENLVLNPASSGGSRYLLMTIAIEAGDEKTKADLTVRDAELKDLILTTLGKKTVDELADPNAKEGIKLELMNALKERFGKKSVKQLYFPQFVIQ